MVLATFTHLPEEKQTRVLKALLNEFSHYPLAEAQVARIVKDAGIARGAFYKYFEDLPAAYQYLFGTTMKAIHVFIPQNPDIEHPEQYIKTIRDFFTAATNQNYLKLFQMHYRYNETSLGAEASELADDAHAPRRWAIMTLFHQTVHDIILDPDHLDKRLAQLRIVLQQHP